MIALDTNVLVRVITKDDIDQARQAAELLRGPGPFWIARSVVLELGWVLGSKRGYGYTAAEVSRALGAVVRLRGVTVEDGQIVDEALRLHATGLDLGDAFLLASAPEGAVVATFDARLVSAAGGYDVREVGAWVGPGGT